MLAFVEGSYCQDLRQSSIKVSVVEEYSGRVHNFLPSVTQTHSQYQVAQPNAPTYSEPLEYQQVR
jgi:hypothetical protein